MRSLIPLILVLLTFGPKAFAQDTPLPRYSIPDLNKRAAVLISPIVSDEIIFGELDGTTISLRVVIDREGNVESVLAPASFSAEVRAAAEQAAKESKFQPLVVNGARERYFGHLQYSFAYQRMDWFAFGTGLKSVHNFDNISVGPVAAKLTVRWAEERAKLEAIDRVRDIDERIKTIASMIDHFRSKLTGREQWLFSAAVVVRNATFWSMVGGAKINRAELQSALERIASVTKNAPPDIPAEFVEALKRMSEYQVGLELGERELRQEVSRLAMSLRNYPR